MDKLTLLLVEDDESDIQSFIKAVKLYNKKKELQGKFKIDGIVRENVKDAREELDGSLDGAIIDLRLDKKGEGQQVIEHIEELSLRIPTVVLTGNPKDVAPGIANLGVRIKGEKDARYANLLKLFHEIHDTGLTHIIGGRGTIEENLYKAFNKNIMPQIDTWIKYAGKNKDRTQKALLRHILNHMLHYDEDYPSFPEEVYIYPPVSESISTGSIVKKGSSWYVVITPACDLIIRKSGEHNTDRIHLVEVEKEDDVFNVIYSEVENINAKTKKKISEKMYRNNHTLYYHWLPKPVIPMENFEGGFVNFRGIRVVAADKFKDKPVIQISPPFVKDLVARFSSYYARQGQPDIVPLS